MAVAISGNLSDGVIRGINCMVSLSSKDGILKVIACTASRGPRSASWLDRTVRSALVEDESANTLLLLLLLRGAASGEPRRRWRGIDLHDVRLLGSAGLRRPDTR